MLHFMWNDYQLCENSYSIYEFANAEIPKWAEYYLSKRTKFHQSIWEAGRVTDKPDDILPNFCDRNRINHVVLTYPSKKTTHYNPYHLYDFKLQDILNLFSKFTCYRHFNWEYEFDVVFLMRNL